MQPITSGTKWVFKKPLFVKDGLDQTKNIKSGVEVDTLDDGGGDWLNNCKGGRDY